MFAIGDSILQVTYRLVCGVVVTRELYNTVGSNHFMLRKQPTLRTMSPSHPHLVAPLPATFIPVSGAMSLPLIIPVLTIRGLVL